MRWDEVDVAFAYTTAFEHDEDGVGCGAHHDNRQYVLAPDSLSKHEQVLCADGHDER